MPLQPVHGLWDARGVGQDCLVVAARHNEALGVLLIRGHNTQAGHKVGVAPHCHLPREA